MNKQLFQKVLTATGIRGSINATVWATMNYSSTVIKGTNASSHEDYSKTIPLHKVEVVINGETWKSVLEIKSEQMVLNNSEILIKEAQKYIDELVNQIAEPSFFDKMKSLFGEQ